MKRTKDWTVAKRGWALTALVFFLFAATSFAQTGRSGESYLTTADVNVRQGPGLNYRIVAKIPRNTKVLVVGREKNWLKVQSKHGNPPGYIDDRYARPMGRQATQDAPVARGYYVTTQETLVREGPGTQYRSVTQIPRGIKVQVVGAEGNWLKIQSAHGRQAGYIERSAAVPAR